MDCYIDVAVPIETDSNYILLIQIMNIENIKKLTSVSNKWTEEKKSKLDDDEHEILGVSYSRGTPDCGYLNVAMYAITL